MVYQWYQTGTTATVSASATATNAAYKAGAEGASITDASKIAANWNYFSSPEDGARIVKGWFKVVPPEDDNTFEETTDTFAAQDSEDESERWYYADSDGLVAGQIKKIKGKYYGFWPNDGQKAGRMLTGLCALEMDGEKIAKVIYADMDSDDLDNFLDAYDHKNDSNNNSTYLYYFGSDSQKDTDGAMKTGSTTITLDGDSYNFYFSKTGGAESKGRGVTGRDGHDYIYSYGQKVKADADEKYILVYADNVYGVAGTTVYEVDSADVRNAVDATGYNKDNEYVSAVTAGQFSNKYFLVNTSGKIQKSGSAKKDGDDWYWYVENYAIKLYSNNKTLTNASGSTSLGSAITGWKNNTASSSTDQF
jgi:hypothetical protein